MTISALIIQDVTYDTYVTRVIIGASLSEPLLDELAGAFLWYIYIYIYIFVSMGSPFGPAWAPHKRATRKRKAG